MRVIATTALRRTVIGREPTGRIFDLDFEGRRIGKVMPVPDPVDPFSYPNPRGGPRGGRGARVHDGTIYITSYDTIYKYDMKWRPKGTISHPLGSDLHEIWVDDGGIWASASGIDSVLRFDHEGNVTRRWCFRDDPALMREVPFDLPPIDDLTPDYRRFRDNRHDCGHLNSVIPEGDHLIVTLGFLKDKYAPKTKKKSKKAPAGDEGKSGIRALYRSMYNKYLHEKLYRSRRYRKFRMKGLSTECVILRVDPVKWRSEILFRSPSVMPDHNGVPWDGRTVLLNKTSLMELYVIDRATGVPRKRVPLPGTHLRGLARVDKDRVLVGTSPAALHLVDIRKGKVLETMPLTDYRREAIHGLCIVED